METLTHHRGCTANYPEKLESEELKHLTFQRIDNNEIVIQCVDCGAFIIIKEQM